MTIRELVNNLESDGLNHVEISQLMGISVLQVVMYGDGRTQSAGAKVALSIYRHIKLDGDPLIIEPHRGKQDIFDTVDRYEDQCAQIIGDPGYGSYNLTSTSV